MRFFKILLLLTVLSACKSEHNLKNEFLQFVKKGTINRVVTKVDASNTYSLFLPKNYKTDSLLPIVYCFDPKGDGNLPVNLLKDYAEKHGYILVGSNASKNGLSADELSYITGNLWTDTHEKLAIDFRRIYVLGFSGGARVASSMALTYNNINGVIACSAGFRPYQGQSKFNFVGIAGNEDMNFLEMKNLYSILGEMQFRQQLWQFNGPHQWPPRELLENALSSFEIMAMNDGLIVRNSKTQKEFFDRQEDAIKDLIKSDISDSLEKAYELVINVLSCTKHKEGRSNFEDYYFQLKNNQKLLEILENREKSEKRELEIQQQLSKSIASQSIGWWQDELNNLTVNSKNNKNKFDALSSKRLLAYVSLMCYSYANAALKQQNMQIAEKILFIYEKADPINADCFYFKACLLSMQNKIKESVDALKKSISLGFTDMGKISKDPLLNNIKSDSDFKQLLTNFNN